MKILLVITSLGVGGAERLLVSLADQFASHGHEVLLMTLHGEVKLKPHIRRVKIVCLGIKKTPLGAVKAIFRFRRVMNDFRPDVVNSHLVHANIFTRIMRILTPIPNLVSSAHNTNEEGRLRIIAYRVTDSLADISTNVSGEAVKAFEDQGAVKHGRMKLILNGVDTGVYKPDKIARANLRNSMGVDIDDLVLLAVGRLSEQKDYPNLIRALALLRDRGLYPHLWIVGEGPLRSELEALVSSLKISDQVKFLGLRRDIVQLMSACDLYVMSSAWEGLPMVILEAMSCANVVVATDCGGVREALGDSQWLVQPRNSLALANGIEVAIGMDELQRKMTGWKNRERIKNHFSLTTTALNYLGTYAEILGKE